MADRHNDYKREKDDTGVYRGSEIHYMCERGAKTAVDPAHFHLSRQFDKLRIRYNYSDQM